MRDKTATALPQGKLLVGFLFFTGAALITGNSASPAAPGKAPRLTTASTTSSAAGTAAPTGHITGPATVPTKESATVLEQGSTKDLTKDSTKDATLRPSPGLATEPSSAKHKLTTKSSKSAKHANNKEQLIPPPPAVQPSLFFVPEFGATPFLYDVMSKPELLAKKKELDQQAKDLQDALKDQRDRAGEAKERAERFKPLFTEGVVSRHELEAAAKEAVEADHELERATRRVNELAGLQKSIDLRLSEFSTKTGAGSARMSKKSKGAH
jgi:hypothetical protein